MFNFRHRCSNCIKAPRLVSSRRHGLDWLLALFLVRPGRCPGCTRRVWVFGWLPARQTR